MKKYLFILSRMPHKGSYLQETLDAVLTAAAFDQQVSLLFLDNGVFQLKRSQQPQTLAFKNTSAMFNALAIYDVNDLYIEQESLQSRGLNNQDLILPTQGIYRREVSALMASFDVIIPD